MIKHIVFLKLSKDGFDNIDTIVSKLNGLKDDISYIRSLEVGVNFAQEDRAFDVSLTVVLDDKDSLNDYAIDPNHTPVIEYLKSLGTTSKVVDYEFEVTDEDKISQASIIKKANTYFDGNVTSRTVELLDGTIKTLGIMMPGSYTFGTQKAEVMDILQGDVEVTIDGKTSCVKAGESFEVGANSSFDIKVNILTDYCCNYID